MAATAPSSAAARHIPPAGVHGMKTETYESSSNEVKALIRQLNRLASASTMEEHNLALQGFDEDVTLDTPFIQIQGRDRVRFLSAITKFFLGTFEIEPRLIKIQVPESAAVKGGILDIDGIVHWLPHRPWFLPFTFLLPKDIPIFADVSMGVKAHNDKVYFISGKNHNMPHVPRVLRVLGGYVVGMAASIAEPAVNNLRDWYRAGVEGASNATHTVRDTTSNVTGQARDFANRATESVRDTVAPVVDTISDKVPLVGKAAENVGLKTPHTTPTTNPYIAA